MPSYPVHMTWQPLDLCHNSNSFNDITPFIGMTAQPLYVQYRITYIRHHTHILLFYEMTPHFVWHHMHWFLTSLPLYLTLHRIYLCHQDQCISYTTPTLCMTSHTLYVWQHTQNAWHHMDTLWRHTRICMTSPTVYLWHLNNIYDINATAFMKTQLYLTSHPLLLTSQPLYLCCNTHCIDQSQQF